MEKPSIALSSKSISTVDQEPFMESSYRSFFYTKIKARNRQKHPQGKPVTEHTIRRAAIKTFLQCPRTLH
ncbi:MAG: hypothetical protein OEZ25_07470, partial [Candidatus Bathyarchaeota archaeon]|nr:hypothetical protein [Candidatus Bathyarchaeota archaeon]